MQFQCKLKVKIAIIIMMFLFVGAFFIISENNLALRKSGNVDRVIGLYSLWISQLFDNTLAMTGNVIKMNWLPDSPNKTG
ncbi:MAG: hypothetical protein ABH840_02465 [Nanoarchaeota archaeon]